MTERTAIAYGVTEGVATLRLDRPERRNAIDDGMRAEMIAVLEEAAGDPAVRALVVTGTGSAFCAGGDVRGMRNRLAAPQEDVAYNGWRRQQRTHRAVALLHTMPKPTIAAVNGAAAGLGCDVALSCDFIISTSTAQFGFPEITLNTLPGWGGTQLAVKKMGLAQAKEMVLTGHRYRGSNPVLLTLGSTCGFRCCLIGAATQKPRRRG
jgi:enoyl-CoA hydratase/carnithine racemase